MHPRELSIADFSYDLPEDRIAQRPLAERDASRLLQYRKGVISDHHFRDLPDLLPSGALLVLNDTRVVNARLLFRRATGTTIEVLCLEPAGGMPVEQAFAARGEATWQAMIGNAKKWKEAERLELHAQGVSLFAQRAGEGLVRFTWEPRQKTFAEVLDQLGHVPLPPYMKRADAASDRDRYNTVFARHEGSVAAPTASLHFSRPMMDRLAAKGITTTSLTLHVGAGTFAPVKSDRMAGHPMHREQVRVPLASTQAISQQLATGRPIVAVGTTALRTLESLYWHGVMILQGRAGEEMDIDQWEPYAHDAAVLPDPLAALEAVMANLSRSYAQLPGSTRLLIAPGYGFRFADALVTNFHQPKSTLLLLVAAFLGPYWRRAYQHALSDGYRFLSYGDGSLLWRRSPAGLSHPNF